MLRTEICHHCRHASYAHVDGECIAHDQQGTCGCIRFEALQRKVRQRTWIVSVSFFEKNRWTTSAELRVQASTSGGAALKAVRQARRERNSRRRITSTRIVASPVPYSGACSIRESTGRANIRAPSLRADWCGQLNTG